MKHAILALTLLLVAPACSMRKEKQKNSKTKKESVQRIQEIEAEELMDQEAND